MTRLPARLLNRLTRDWLLLVLLAGFPVVFWLAPLRRPELPALVD